MFKRSRIFNQSNVMMTNILCLFLEWKQSNLPPIDSPRQPDGNSAWVCNPNYVIVLTDMACKNIALLSKVWKSNSMIATASVRFTWVHFSKNAPKFCFSNALSDDQHLVKWLCRLEKRFWLELGLLSLPPPGYSFSTYDKPQYRGRYRFFRRSFANHQSVLCNQH